MKNIMKSLMLVAVAAMGFVSCSNKFEEENIQSGKTFSLVISAEKPSLESESRTEFVDGAVVWSSDDKIRVAYKEDNGKWSKYYASNEAQSEDDFKTATFALNSNFTSNEDNYPTEGATYTFYAGYPSTVIGSSTNAPSNDALSVKVATEQTMKKAGTFDATADIMVGVSSEYNEWPTEPVGLTFARLVAHGCVTLKNFAAEENETVKSVTFTAPEGVNLTGSGSVNFVEQTMTALDNNTVKVTLPANTLATENVAVWFCSAPATIAAEETLTVEVTTTRGTYTRTITARAGGINFLQNRYNTLSIDMASAEFEAQTVDYTGTYAVLVKQNSTYYALSSEANSTRLWAREFTWNGTDEKIVVTDAYLAWNVTASDLGYKFENGGQYLTYGDNKASMTAAGTVCTITPNDDGTYVVGASGRNLSKNTSALYWGFYADTQADDIYLVAAEYKSMPIVTPSQETVALTDEAVTDATEIATIADATEVVVATYNDEACSEACTWLSAAYADGKVTYTAEANTGEEARSAYLKITATNANGETIAVVKFNQAAKAAAGAAEWVKVTSLADVTEGTYIITAGGYYLPNTTKASKPDAISMSSAGLVESNGVLSGTITDAMKWNLTGTTAGMTVTQFGGTNKLFNTSSTTVGVGATSCTWEITAVTGGFYFASFNNSGRILTVYSSQDWRAYASSNPTNNNSAVPTVVLYKLSAGGEGGGDVTPTPTLSLDKSELSFDADGGSQTITATTTNYDGDITASSDNNHFTTSVSGNVVTVIASVNEDSTEKTATITITAGDLSETVSVSQAAKEATGGEGEGGNDELKVSTLNVENINAVQELGNGSYGVYKDTDVEITIEGVTYTANNICANVKNTPSSYAAKTFIQIKKQNYIYNTTATVKSIKIWTNDSSKYSVKGGSTKNPSTALTASSTTTETVAVKDNNGNSMNATLTVQEFDVTGGYFKIQAGSNTAYIYKVEVTYQ